MTEEEAAKATPTQIWRAAYWRGAALGMLLGAQLTLLLLYILREARS